MPRIYEQIIGCDYPVKDMNGVVVSSRKITKSIMLENVAGIVIGLDAKQPSILISLNEASILIEEKLKKEER
jgi:hypothetical protein